MPQAVLHGILLRARRDLVEERLGRERVLQPRGRAQGTGEERREDRVHQHALARHGSRAVVLASDTARHVGGHRVVAIVEVGRIRRR